MLLGGGLSVCVSTRWIACVLVYVFMNVCMHVQVLVALQSYYRNVEAAQTTGGRLLCWG